MKKRIMSAVCAALMLFGAVGAPAADAGIKLGTGIFASAADVVESGQCGDNVYYTIDSDGVLTISGEGDMYDWDDSWSNSSPFRSSSSFNAVIIENGVTNIGNNTFYNTRPTSITIPQPHKKN